MRERSDGAAKPAGSRAGWSRSGRRGPGADGPHRTPSPRGPVRWVPLSLLVALAVTACDDDGTAPPAPASVAPTGGTAQTAEVGTTLGQPLQVTVLDGDGQPFQGATVTWAVTAGGGSVSPTSSTSGTQGTASTTWTLGGTVGSQTVQATVAGLAAVTFTATASVGAPDQVVVTPGSATLDALGSTADFTAELQDAFGNEIAGAAFAWGSSDEGVATVDGAGTATAVGVGTATVTATAQGIDGTATIEVRQVAAGVAVTPEAPQLVAGNTVQLTATVTDANDQEIPGAAVTWSSSDEAVATVDGAGVVTGVAEGSATVTATSGNASGTTEVTVVEVPDDFAPSADTEVSGTLEVGAVSIPAGVTVTATGDLTILASGPVDIQGALQGDCVALSVTGQADATYAGTISNACTSEDAADLPDVTLVNDGALTVDGAVFTYAGDLVLRNNPALPPASASTPESLRDFAGITRARVALAAASGAPAALQGGPCIVRGGQFIPSMPAARSGDDGQTFGGDAAGTAGDVDLTCDGDLQMRGHPERGPSTVQGRHGGEGGDAGNFDPGTDDAVGRGGDGGDGGDLEIEATGDITFDDADGGTVIEMSDGGKGGDATVLGRDPGGNAEATGGNGGDGGNLRVEGGAGIFIDEGGLTIDIGKGGDGGEAIANAGNGKDADDTAATDGGSSKATGGNGGDSVDGQLTAAGNVVGESRIVLTGGDGGAGGEATAVAGKGGDGNDLHPHGANGGNMEAVGGNGGVAQTRGLASPTRPVAGGGFPGAVNGRVVGTSGDAGNARIVNGRGGNGEDRCDLPDTGGNGGKGGNGSGRPGEPGGGENPGAEGLITVADMAGNGGDGDDGEPTFGTKGAGGDDDGLPAPPVRVDEGEAFEDGIDGVLCPPPPPPDPIIFLLQIEILQDLLGHAPFIGLPQILEAVWSFLPSGPVLEGATLALQGDQVTLTAPSPWIDLSGTLDPDGTFSMSGRGTAAGFNDVLVTFEGTLEGGELQGTLTYDAENDTFPPGDHDGDPNTPNQRSPAIYSVTGTAQSTSVTGGGAP